MTKYTHTDYYEFYQLFELNNVFVRYKPIIKHLDTGKIRFYFLKGDKFLIQFKVLEGYKHNFIESVDIFDLELKLFKSVYRLRNIKTNDIDSIVDLLKKYLKEIYFLNKTADIDNEIEELFTISESKNFSIAFILSTYNFEYYRSFFKPENF